MLTKIKVSQFSSLLRLFKSCQFTNNPYNLCTTKQSLILHLFVRCIQYVFVGTPLETDVIFVTSSVCVKQILSGKIPLCKGLLVDLGSMIFKILGASRGEYKQLPINWRLFQNTVREDLLQKKMFSFGHCPNEGGLARIKKYTLYIPL